MKRILTSCAVILAGVAILASPGELDACSVCDSETPTCNPAINRRCYAYPDELACEEYRVSCAYAYAPAEISADGSIASLSISRQSAPTGEQARGCHGLILDRKYSETRESQARADSEHIVL